ncbi:GlxA family transcriptional regulator [Mycoplana dimorpha]|uniref:AraC family carnitine catabolism transcriptional activator n=1 Tax=Mycoplana dimorpha TaxID=28320 RepID=A0A2T5B8X0_MYCDI|nr:GlxA family transcriptional regulator [Mycoplana dimorpha]PTM95442.1 AraC family carnitine catabolism transcriptional activator [Mycoplana dimorpha]
MNAPHNHSIFEAGTPIPEKQAAHRSPRPVGKAAVEFLVLVLPGFSQLSLGSLIEPLRLSNALTRDTPFTWRIVSLDGEPVECASGFFVSVAGSLFEVEKSLGPKASLVLCAGENVENCATAALRGVLRRAWRAGAQIYALGTATWLLADAAVLLDARCTIHWSRLAALSEKYASLAVDDVLFVRDGPIVTCAGGLAAFDLAVDLIQQMGGPELARSVCQHVTADRWRDGASCQPMPFALRGAGKRLMPIIRLMETHIEEPLSLEDISRRVSLSRRQIERLFEKHLSRTPWRHYLALRLTKARQLVELTDMPITEVAVACGFVSPTHFSRTFRDYFGALPRLRNVPGTKR